MGYQNRGRETPEQAKGLKISAIITPCSTEKAEVARNRPEERIKALKLTGKEGELAARGLIWLLNLVYYILAFPGTLRSQYLLKILVMSLLDSILANTRNRQLQNQYENVQML